MALIDFILNLAGILLWVNWRATGFSARPAPLTLAAAVRRTESGPSRRWLSLLGLAVLLVARAFIYWKLEPALVWSPKLPLGATTLFTRCHLFSLALSYSLLSFALAIAVFHFWLLLLAALHRRPAEGDLWARLIRAQLGRVGGWPAILKILLPFVATALLWFLAEPLLVRLHYLQPPVAAWHTAQRALVISLGTVLAWKWLLLGICLLHLLNSYIYFGNAAFWNFVSATGKSLLRPLAWLRLGRLDLSPVAGGALVWFGAELLSRELPKLYGKLPL